MKIPEKYARHYMDYALQNREDWDWFDTEWDQIQRAWDWVKNQEATLGLSFLRIFDTFLDKRNLWSEEIMWSQEGIRLSEELGDLRQKSIFQNYLVLLWQM